MFGLATATSPRYAAQDSTARAHGVKLMSLGFIVERDAPANLAWPDHHEIITRSCACRWGSSTTSSWTSRPARGPQLSLTQAIGCTAR